MKVACFCGVTFYADADLARCPECGDPAVIPRVTDRDEQGMRFELALLLTPDQGETPCD